MFKVQSYESNLIELLESYRIFSELDLSTYDLVITGKYPAWMLNHPNHKVYMLHKLRGLYDTYHFAKEPIEYIFPDSTTNDQKIKQITTQLLVSNNLNNNNIKEILNELISLLKNEPIDQGVNKFPGSFSRMVVHALDNYALNPKRIKNYFAISNTVKKRDEYFPNGVNINVLYPPPRLSGFKCLEQDYFFTTSRLDGPKRIDKLIEAMGHIKVDTKLYIAGTGPREKDLHKMAVNDKRIIFLGHLKDQELIQYYSNSLAVLFVPYDEDYGLVTIEAMKSGKPVITVNDSGGVNEFVEHNKTGLSVAPNPKAIAEAMEYMYKNKSEAKLMGIEAQRRVSNIKWLNVVEGLFGPTNCLVTKRKKMTVLVTFPIYPARGGGQSRVFHLYKEFSNKFDIDLISLGAQGDDFYHEISNHFREHRIGKSQEHQAEENKIAEKVGWLPVTDIAAIELIWKTPKFVEKFEDLAAQADVLVLCHPYLVHLALNSVESKKCEIWLEVQDVEFDIKTSILPNNLDSKSLLELVKQAESKAWLNADCTFACSKNDLLRLESIYGKTDAKLVVVPNGYSPDDVKYINKKSKYALKNKLMIREVPMAVFVGSWHGPNIEAVDIIINIAQSLPSIIFAIVGSVGSYYNDKQKPNNVKFFGVLDDEEKLVALAAADLAINPMKSGSGSNLKMLDYMASGVPVLSTSFGARGLEAEPGVHFICAEVDSFCDAIVNFFIEFDQEEINKIVAAAKCLAEEKYSWPVIGKDALQKITI